MAILEFVLWTGGFCLPAIKKNAKKRKRVKYSHLLRPLHLLRLFFNL
jgi:hypothetical protein